LGDAAPNFDTANALVLRSDQLSAQLYQALPKEVGFHAIVAPDVTVIDGALQDVVPGLIVIDLACWYASLIGTFRDLRVRSVPRVIPLVSMINQAAGPDPATPLAPVCDTVLTKLFSVPKFLTTIRCLGPFQAE